MASAEHLAPRQRDLSIVPEIKTDGGRQKPPCILPSGVVRKPKAIFV